MALIGFMKLLIPSGKRRRNMPSLCLRQESKRLSGSLNVLKPQSCAVLMSSDAESLSGIFRIAPEVDGLRFLSLSQN